jgi:hypothetical protein
MIQREQFLLLLHHWTVQHYRHYSMTAPQQQQPLGQLH